MRCRWWIALVLVLVGVWAAARELTVLAVSDVHGQWLDGENGAGWPRVATILTQERDRAGAENTLLIDCGDELVGSLPLAFSYGALGIEVMNFLEFDVWVPGNHDYEWGVTRLRELAAQFTGAVLAANWDGAAKTAYFERAGLKIAVVGLTTELLDYYTRLPGEEVRIASEAGALRAAMREVRRQSCDVIILALHRGVYTARGLRLDQLIADYPEIDLVVGGHAHVVAEGESVGGIHFTAPGVHGAGVSRIVIDAMPGKAGRGTKIASQFLPVTKKIAPHRAFVRHISSRYQLAAAPVVLGRTDPVPAHAPKRRYASSLGSLALMGLTAELPGVVGLYGTSTSRRSWSAQITDTELFAMFPYQDWAVQFPLSRAELVAVIEEQLRLSEKFPYHPVMSGLRVTADSAGKVVALEPELEEYQLATSNFIAAGGGGRYAEFHRISREREWRFHGVLRDRIAMLLRQTPFPLSIDPIEWLTVVPASRQLR